MSKANKKKNTIRLNERECQNDWRIDLSKNWQYVLKQTRSSKKCTKRGDNVCKFNLSTLKVILPILGRASLSAVQITFPKYLRLWV